MNRLRASIVRLPHRRPAVRFVALALWLAVCLLGSRWIGLVHQADHGPLSILSALSGETSAPLATHESATNHIYGSQHSCAAFDAATLGDTVDVPLVETPPERAVAFSAPRFRPTSLPRQSGCPFSSRAPPAA